MEKVAQAAMAMIAVFWTVAFVFFPEGVGQIMYEVDEVRYPSYICE